jgi:hypothetical protein
MSLFDVAASGSPGDPGDLVAPSLVAAFDGWVDAGSAATTALAQLLDGAPTVVRFEGDQLFDYRARRPTLRIVDGRLSELTWPELAIKRARVGERDLLILAGPEPDDRWQTFSAALVELARRFEVQEWISLGSIPAAVPHTRAVPILGTESEPGHLRGDVQAGPAVGYFAQVPHYVSGAYPAASVALLSALGRHLGVILPSGDLVEEARQLRTRLDAAAALDDSTRQYVERLESMVDDDKLPSGDELIGEIERFLREGGTEGSQRN